MRPVGWSGRTPGSRAFYVDVNRTDNYVPTGTEARPYKVLTDAVTVANLLATATSPVWINVKPGTYNCDPFTLYTDVKLQGSGWGTTRLLSNNLLVDFITLKAGAIIRDVTIYGPTAVGKSCIISSDNDSNPVVAANVTISRGYYGFRCNPNASVGEALLENFTFVYDGSNIETLLRCEGFGELYAVSSIAAGPDNAIACAFCATGANAYLTLVDCYHLCGTGDGAMSDDGAMLRLVGGIFSHGVSALKTGTNGSPRIRAEGTLIHRIVGGGYTNDILVGTVNSSVHFIGTASQDRIVNAVGGSLQCSFQNRTPGLEGFCVLGELGAGSAPTSTLPMIAYGKAAYLTGLYSGGDVTQNASPSRVLDVDAGTGYVNDGTNPVRVTWDATTVTIGASSSEYVYVTSAGVVSHSAVQPSYASNIILAQAVTNANDVVLLTRDEIEISHSLSRIQEFFEDCIGPLTITGCVLSMSGTALKLDVSSGEFVVGISERDVTGDTDAPFWYVSHDGAGGWTYTASTVIDTEHLDLGSGPVDYPGADHWKKDAWYVIVNAGGEEYYCVYGQTAFADQASAEAGAMPVAPEVLQHYGLRIGGIVSHKLDAAITSIVDTRPTLGPNTPLTAPAGVDHSTLLNLANDDHLQYLTTTRANTWHSGLSGAHVTNGDSHDHTAGAGAQIDHTTLSNIGTLTHTQLETAIGLKLDASEKSAANGVASLNASSLVVQNPANATAVPTASKIPIADGSGKLDGWVTPAVYGANYQTATSVVRSTYNTTTAFQTKVSLVTAAVTGTYRVGWTCVMDGSVTNQSVEAQLYNVTDAAIVGVVQILRPSNSNERIQFGGFAEVSFVGAAKTFSIQYRTQNTLSTVGIADARIEFWRVA